ERDAVRAGGRAVEGGRAGDGCRGRVEGVGGGTGADRVGGLDGEAVAGAVGEAPDCAVDRAGGAGGAAGRSGRGGGGDRAAAVRGRRGPGERDRAVTGGRAVQRRRAGDGRGGGVQFAREGAFADGVDGADLVEVGEAVGEARVAEARDVPERGQQDLG